MHLNPGTYLIRVSKQGYDSQTKKVTLGNADTTELQVALKAHKKPTAEEPAPQSAEATPDQAPANAGRLFVQPDPPDATVRILSIKPVFKQGIVLEPGKYMVDVSKQGYATRQREVRIKKGQDTTVEIALFLKADMGKLYVNTDPMDADVSLPNIKPKYEPGMELSPGDYAVKISKEGFQTVTTDVKIDTGKIKRLNVTLKRQTTVDKKKSEDPAGQKEPPRPPQQGTLTIELTPPDAAVRILDIDKPYTAGMKLDSGFYVVEAQKEGYVTGTSKIAIKPDQNNSISLTLALQPGHEPAPAPEQDQAAEQAETDEPAAEPGKERLFVEHMPADALVRVLNIGPKYKQGMVLGPGKYKVEVRKKGVGKVVKTVEVAAGKDTHVTIDLTKGSEQEPPAPATGTLTVETNLEHPVISIDGKPGFGKETALSPGQYQVRVSGKLPNTEKSSSKTLAATVSAGETTTLQVLLTPPEKPKQTSKPKPPEAVASKPAAEKISAPEAPSAAKAKPRPKEQPPMTNNAESLRQSALEAIERQEYSQALQLVRQALALATPDAASYMLLGRIHSLMTNPAKALEAYTKALALMPDHAMAYALRGDAYVLLNDTDSACYDYWKACSLGKCREISLAKKNGVCR